MCTSDLQRSEVGPSPAIGGTPPYYLDWFERSYPNVPLDRDDGPFCLQCMNGIQGTKPAGRQRNRLLDAVVKIIEYKNSTIDHAIYIKVFDDGTVSYLTVSTDDVFKTTNNKNVFPELTRVFRENFEMKVQEVSVLNYLNFRIFQSPLGFSIDQTDHIMELVNECFPTGKFRNVDTPFWIDSSYEKELLVALPLKGHALQKAEMEYRGKFAHTLGNHLS